MLLAMSYCTHSHAQSFLENLGKNIKKEVWSGALQASALLLRCGRDSNPRPPA